MADGGEEKDIEARKLIAKIGQQLAASKTCPNKHSLVKLLKQATTAFPELKQSESLKSVVKPLSDSFVRHSLLQHRDKDVKLLVGICLCEIIRVIAPNPEFSDAVFRDIFILILSLFGDLDDIASPYFSWSVKSLETVAKLQFFVLMLDTGCEDLVLKLFKIFFNVVREDHPQSLINSMSSIIARILEEKVTDAHSDPLNFEADITQQLLDLILQHIIKEGEGVSSASFELAVSVLKNCDGKLEHYICQFLTSCILNRDAAGSVVKEFYHEIIFQIFQIAPQMLLSVIPNLTHELLTDQVDVRLKALNLIRKLLSLPGNHIAREYRLVFIELLNRFSDKSAEVRLTAISCAKCLFLTNPSGSESLEVLSAIHGRLLDHDEKVRSEAVKVMCDLAKTNINLVSSDLISGTSERLRDKKVSVRKTALQKLVELYQEYCTRCAAGNTFLNEQIEQIPCNVLMLCFGKDCPEFRPQSLELVLADLFPTSLSTEERTKHWILMFSIFKPPHVKALKIILHQKRRLQDWLQEYLDLWSRTEVVSLEGNGSEDAERKLEALVLKMSACFCDPVKARGYFHELTDKGTAIGLQQLFRKRIALDCQTTMDGYLRELGKQNLPSEFFHILSTKASFNIFNSKQVQYILDRLSSDEAESKRLKDYSVQLLLTIVGAFPSLLRGSEKQFQLLLSEKVIPFNEDLIEIFAKEGSQLSIKLSHMYSPLAKLCLEATRVQSKLVVSAIAALADASEQFVLSELCKMLVDSLCNGQNTPTVLQSLGCVAQHFVSTFETQEKLITQYIVEEIFQQNDALASKDLVLLHESSESCSSCKLKVFGLKTLVRSFLPHKRSTPRRSISFLMDIIHRMLQKNVCSDRTIPCKYDESHIRLAAAKSVIRLSRKWELHISPQIFRLTVLTSKDKSPWIRRSFVNKLYKLLRNQVLPIRYACAFSFAAVDSLKDLRCDARKYLEEYIRKYCKGTQIHETMNMKEAANDPLYVTVFLIHVLAHDTDFPAPDCQDEDMYAKFLSPLFITLQAILDVNIVHSNSCHSSNVSSFLRSIFHAIKKAEDAVDGQMTPKLHLLADVGISILNSLNTDNARPLSTGLILLPSSLYKSGPAKTREANIYPSNGYRIDAHFTKKLISSLKTEIGNDVHLGQQIHKNSLWPKCKIDAKSGNMEDLEMNKIKDQFGGPHTGNEELFETSYQEVDTGTKINQIMSSPHGSARLHNKFTVGNGNFKDTHKNFDAKLSFSCGSEASRSLFAQKGANTSNRSEEDTGTRGSNACAEQSNLSRATDHMICCSSKIIKSSGEAFAGKHPEACSTSEICVMDDLDSINGIHQDLDEIASSSLDHGVGCCTNDQRKNLGAFEYDSIAGSLPKNRDFCTGAPQAAKRDRKLKDAVDVSTSEVINMDSNAVVPRRTRRRKI
ncbi:sister chromatid cohesion protein PDS5 homolog B isoform X2 [Henckelia pumila]|uniref:sister chromatid cohesion protein PDS5 homolog B isoform X2 n=1 Tax=Henckelia pumila TaxID=405737 RepID=UPI003C6E53D2